ncbi:hypothetical protein FHS83_001018 [Rhizomicrobium palustre]|jgi:hypothetical protein|uniref:Uncharacterized protein n=1 Tax=Rhizomicrobium palustre TaxID=189966 RepID=A0A846MXF1_9PROT|nr:hypothetical protein [Rhizomicrobium palustre]NIK87700.1 hypothetical protein [Rhizomicrobium palustre]
MNGSWSTLAYFGATALVIVILGIAAVFLYLVVVNRIEVKDILAEPESGKASLSRLQFLIFTFVIAGLFLLLSIEAGTFVTIPESVLWLLGLSGGSYTLSKGIAAQTHGPAARASANASAAQAAAAAAVAAAAAQSTTTP